MKTHKSIAAVLALICLFAVEAKAQSGLGSDTACVGLKNPVNFTLSGGHSEIWTGYNGSMNGCTQYSNCTHEAATYVPTPIQAADLASYNNTNGCTSVSYEGAASTTSRDVNNQLDYSRQFVIKGPGTDPETHGHLSYLPTEFDSTIVRSIRLGNYCGNAGAEKLTYDLDINYDNALLTIYYALSLQNGQHNGPTSSGGGTANPEFTIVVKKQQGSDWVLVDCQKLTYFRPTPAGSNSNVDPFYVGSTGTHTGASYACNVYLPWQKVMINLYDYIYDRIRIQITSGDCSASAHYALCYIAGDCQPMKLITSGCAAGESNAVTTIKAPKGAISYQWYRSKTGKLTGEARESDNSYVAIDGATDDSLGCTADHFRPIGLDTMYAQTTFMCKITTKMNETFPIVSKLYADVSNTKPYIVVDSALDCGAGITMSNHSYSPINPGNSDLIDQDATEWKFYHSETPTDQTLEGTYNGGTASHTFANAQPGSNNTYSVKVRTYLADDSTCWNEKTVKIRVIKPPVPSIRLERDSLCEGDTIVIFNTTQGATNAYTEWTILGRAGDTLNQVSPTTASRFVFDTTSTVLLRTRNNIHYMQDTNSDGVLDPVYCFVDTSITVHVDEYPDLVVTGDTIVCNGTQAIVDVTSQNPSTTYDWYLSMNSTNALQSNTNRLTTMPTHDERYFVKARSPFGCTSWDSIKIYIVDPHLDVPVVKMCEDDKVMLYASNAYSYTWTSMPDDPSMAGQTTNDTLVVSPHHTTTYTLVGHGMNDCSATPLTQTITVFHHPVPTFEMTPKFIDSEEPVVTFRDVSPESTYTLWNFGNGNTSNEPQIRYTFTDLSEDSIEVKLTTGSGGELACNSDTAFFVPVEIFALWFPNAFTPEESTNNKFSLFTHNQLEYFNIFIYDRQGSLIMSSTDQNFSWDGTYNGHKCPQGVYVYTCTFRRPGTTDIVTRRGTLTLLR